MERFYDCIPVQGVQRFRVLTLLDAVCVFLLGSALLSVYWYFTSWGRCAQCSSSTGNTDERVEISDHVEHSDRSAQVESRDLISGSSEDSSSDIESGQGCLGKGRRLAHGLWRSRRCRCTVSVCTVYLLIGAIFVFVGSLAEFPGVQEWCVIKLDRSLMKLQSKSGYMLAGLNFGVPQGANLITSPPILFFGGNGEGMDGAAKQAINMFMPLVDAHDVQLSIHTLSYPGYFPSPGWPNEHEVLQAAISLMDYVTEHTQYESFILAGTSMGCAVSLQLAKARASKVAGIIIHSPYTSFWDVAIATKPPWTYFTAPWIWVIPKWDSITVVKHLLPQIPLLVLSSGADQTIPKEEHRKLFDASASEKKWFHRVAGQSHTDVYGVANGSVPEMYDWYQASLSRLVQK